MNNRDKVYRRFYLLTISVARKPNQERPDLLHVNLEDPRTGRRLGFANLAALVMALHQEIVDLEQQPDKGGDV